MHARRVVNQGHSVLRWLHRESDLLFLMA